MGSQSTNSGGTNYDTDASANESPVHSVTLSPYKINKYEITVDDYAMCVNYGNCSAPLACDYGTSNYADGSKGAYPVNCVDWQMARDYCQWLGGDLPTEAQWEYAARGEDGRKYPWGSSDPTGSNANLCDTNCSETWKDTSIDDAFQYTAYVGVYDEGTSTFGLFDMAGNVWEWTRDYYAADYYIAPGATQADPYNITPSLYRTLRGGSYNNIKSALRTSKRIGDNTTPLTKGTDIGFRCIIEQFDFENTQITINTGDNATNSLAVNVYLSALDSNGNGINGYCLKETQQNPTLTDTCWQSVAPVKNFTKYDTFTFSNADQGTKTIYAWLKNTTGQISNAFSDTITYQEGGSTVGTNEWVNIPGGTFNMGQDGIAIATPVHPVTLTAFRMLKYEVTATDYKACVDASVCQYNGETSGTYYTYNRVSYDNHPINYVNWSEAQTYCQWVGGDLPTEAQWEYAARGTDGRTYPWGETVPSVTNNNLANCSESYCYDGYSYTSSVGTFEQGKSPFGLYDMAGNVWEWIKDWYSSSYYNNCASGCTDPFNDVSGSDRVNRGGSWVSYTDVLRSSNRVNLGPSYRFSNLGFRCASPQDNFYTENRLTIKKSDCTKHLNRATQSVMKNVQTLSLEPQRF